jgi:small subunit ribosomal protein S16
MLKIKLSIRGKKHQRTYRIFVSEARSKSRGKFVDDLGFYTPQTKTLQIDQEKLDMWLKKGAQPTLGLNRLLDPQKYPAKKPVKKATIKEESPSTPGESTASESPVAEVTPTTE